MEWAALIAWVVTAAGGFVLLAIWLQRGGMRQATAAGSRIRPPLILSHFLLAAIGLVIWIIYALPFYFVFKKAGSNGDPAWGAFIPISSTDLQRKRNFVRSGPSRCASGRSTIARLWGSLSGPTCGRS